MCVQRSTAIFSIARRCPNLDWQKANSSNCHENISRQILPYYGKAILRLLPFDRRMEYQLAVKKRVRSLLSKVNKLEGSG
jgi:hypothetical protein